MQYTSIEEHGNWDLYDCKKVSSWHQPCSQVPNPLHFLFFGCQTLVWPLQMSELCMKTVLKAMLPCSMTLAAGNLAGTGFISPSLSSVVLHVWIVILLLHFWHLNIVFVFGCQNCTLHFHFKLLFSQYVAESSVSLPPF